MLCAGSGYRGPQGDKVLACWLGCGERAKTPNLTESDEGARLAQLANAIFQSVNTVRELRKKTDAEIADLLLDHIWSELPGFSPQADLVLEAIERLRRDRSSDNTRQQPSARDPGGSGQGHSGAVPDMRT